MEYQKIINLLNGTTNQRPKFKARNWVETNHESKGKYDRSNIRFQKLMIMSNLYNYSDEYILLKGAITVPHTETAGAAVNNANKKVIFKNWAPFTDCMTEIDNTYLVLKKLI